MNNNKAINRKEIKAETLIALRDDVQDFSVRMKGVFFRNYSEDLMAEPDNGNEEQIFELSRDGIFHLLPEGLFFEENQLRDNQADNRDFKNKYNILKEEKKKIDLFFQPFDTEYFKLNLVLEKEINAVSEKGNELFSDLFFDIFEPDSDNEYVQKLKILLPFVSELRGNYGLLNDILKNILSLTKIDIITLKPFFQRFIFHKEGLTKEEYIAFKKQMSVFFAVFKTWFLPFEIEYDYKIKDRKQRFCLGESLILDYNTNI
jgi:hypothetical protein